jgi:hypothetical protein
MAAVDERTADSAVERARAIALARNWAGDKDRVNIAKANAELDSELMKARARHDETYAYRKLLEAVHESFVRDAAVVSRELTRRVDKEPPARRSDRWGGGR